jgi:hypothetical protein
MQADAGNKKCQVMQSGAEQQSKTSERRRASDIKQGKAMNNRQEQKGEAERRKEQREPGDVKRYRTAEQKNAAKARDTTRRERRRATHSSSAEQISTEPSA